MDQCIVHTSFNPWVLYLQGDDISFFDTIDDTLVVVQIDGLKRVDNANVMQTFLHGPINLHGSPILFAILQLSTMKQKLKLKSI